MDQSRPGDFSRNLKLSNKEMNIKILFDHPEVSNKDSLPISAFIY